MAPKPKPDPSPEPAERLDFRHADNDAWYDVNVAVEEGGEVLRVMYCDFPDGFDERFRADGFRSGDEVEELRRRVRRGSAQVQDWECREVAVGTEVTVANVFGESDVRFYDAIVHEVKRAEHPFAEGQCKCTFVVLWLHGPLAGDKTVTGIENICLLQPKHLKMDQAVEQFFDIARKKLEERNSKANPSKVGKATCSSDSNNCQLRKPCGSRNLEDDPSIASRVTCSTSSPKAFTSTYNHGYGSGSVDSMLKKHCTSPSDVSKFDRSSDHMKYGVAPCSDVHHDLKVPMTTCSSGSHASASDCWLKESRAFPCNSVDDRISKQADGRRYPPQDEDIELGSGSSNKKRACPKDGHYFFRIENLEKDLSPFDVMDFIFDHTSIASRVFICPGVSNEFYLRGTILVKTDEEAEKLHYFLNDPSHIITSSRGRPWLTDVKWYGSADGTLPSYERSSRKNSRGYLSKINVVANGTKEYRRAKALCMLHQEYFDHVHNDLLERLMEDEQKVLQ